MHYKNGREAKPGDEIVCLPQAVMGIAYNVNAQSDTCNGRLAIKRGDDPYISLKDCLHIDDLKVAEIPDTTKVAV